MVVLSSAFSKRKVGEILTAKISCVFFPQLGKNKIKKLKIHWRRKWQPTPVFLPGESHGQRSLAGLQSMGSHRVAHHDLATKRQQSQTISDAKTFEWTPNKSWPDKRDVSVSHRPSQAWESMNFSNPGISEGQRKKLWGRKIISKILQKIPILVTFRHQLWRKEVATIPLAMHSRAAGGGASKPTNPHPHLPARDAREGRQEVVLARQVSCSWMALPAPHPSPPLLPQFLFPLRSLGACRQ